MNWLELSAFLKKKNREWKVHSLKLKFVEGGLQEIVKEYAGRVLLLWQENNDDAWGKNCSTKSQFCLELFAVYARIKEKGILVSNRYLDVNIGK